MAQSEFAAGTYEKISYDDLITFVVFQLTSKNRGSHQTTFEDIVAEAFRLFPKRFSLRKYPQWPDAAVVNKSWLRCRTDKKLITGSVKDGFKLTSSGLKVADSVSDRLSQPHDPNSGNGLRAELRTQAGRLLRSLENSRQFRDYVNTESVEALTDYDLTEMLIALPDSSPSRLRTNLAHFKDAAQLYERTDVLGFLNEVESRFAKRLGLKVKK